VFGAWPLLEPYALCDRVDRGSGVKLRALIEVLKRGIDVVYSDADVVWRRPFVPPRKPHGAPPYDIAFQSYSPLPDADMEALVQYGTNFGLFHARATKRAIALAAAAAAACRVLLLVCNCATLAHAAGTRSVSRLRLQRPERAARVSRRGRLGVPVHV
jgi:hypothetical protein